MNDVRPNLVIPRRENTDPRYTQLCINRKRPECRRSNVDVAALRHVWLRKADNDPKCTKPMTEMLLEPELNLPKTNGARPICANVWKNKNKPKSRESNVDRNAPILADERNAMGDPECAEFEISAKKFVREIPNGADTQPRREHDLRDGSKSKCKKSKTIIAKSKQG
jgi:hypothetical protein